MVSDRQQHRSTDDALVVELRAAGCVFAEDEAAILVESAVDADDLRAMTARRVAGEPLEHVVGWVDFGGLRVAVGAGVFIPRQRSVFLAHLTVNQAYLMDNPTVVELCCGAAPLASWVVDALPEAKVFACDSDETALAVARRNVSASAVYQGFLFQALPDSLRGGIDIVTAVPPYVPTRALRELPREAREHEPISSLVAGDDGLDVVRQILADANPWIAPRGVLLLEMNRGQIDQAAAIAAGHGWSAVGTDSDDGQTAVLRVGRG